jgi:hypothetical protein
MTSQGHCTSPGLTPLKPDSKPTQFDASLDGTRWRHTACASRTNPVQLLPECTLRRHTASYCCRSFHKFAHHFQPRNALRALQALVWGRGRGRKDHMPLPRAATPLEVPAVRQWMPPCGRCWAEVRHTRVTMGCRTLQTSPLAACTQARFLVVVRIPPPPFTHTPTRMPLPLMLGLVSALHHHPIQQQPARQPPLLGQACTPTFQKCRGAETSPACAWALAGT